MTRTLYFTAICSNFKITLIDSTIGCKDMGRPYTLQFRFDHNNKVGGDQFYSMRDDLVSVCRYLRDEHQCARSYEKGSAAIVFYEALSEFYFIDMEQVKGFLRGLERNIMMWKLSYTG